MKLTRTHVSRVAVFTRAPLSAVCRAYSTEGAKPVSIKGEDLGGGKWKFHFNV